MQKGTYLYEVWYFSGEGKRTQAAGENVIIGWVSEAAEQEGASMEMGVEVSKLRPGLWARVPETVHCFPSRALH